MGFIGYVKNKNSLQALLIKHHLIGSKHVMELNFFQYMSQKCSLTVLLRLFHYNKYKSIVVFKD